MSICFYLSTYLSIICICSHLLVEDLDLGIWVEYSGFKARHNFDFRITECIYLAVWDTCLLQEFFDMACLRISWKSLYLLAELRSISVTKHLSIYLSTNVRLSMCTYLSIHLFIYMYPSIYSFASVLSCQRKI